MTGQNVVMSYSYYQRGDGLTHSIYMQGEHVSFLLITSTLSHVTSFL